MLLVGLATAGLGAAIDVQAQRLGRLFTTPEERALLDELRAEERVAQPVSEPEPEPKAAPEPGPPRTVISRLTINGFIRGSRGPETVWINGDLVERGSVTREGISVEPARSADTSVRLVLPSGTGTVALRPGEQIDIQSGTVLDAYEAQVGDDGPSAFSGAPRPGDAPSSSPEGSTGAAPEPAEPGDAQATSMSASDLPAELRDDPVLRDAMARGVKVIVVDPPERR